MPDTPDPAALLARAERAERERDSLRTQHAALAAFAREMMAELVFGARNAYGITHEEVADAAKMCGLVVRDEATQEFRLALWLAEGA